MSDMDYKEAWNELKEYIRERLCALTEIKDSNTLYDSPLAPEEDGAIEALERSIALIEDAERNRESRGMNYEELWAALWNCLLNDSVTIFVLSHRSDADDKVRLHATGAIDAITAILDQMATIEKKMTTANEGRSEK